MRTDLLIPCCLCCCGTNVRDTGVIGIFDYGLIQGSSPLTNTSVGSVQIVPLDTLPFGD